MIEIKAYEPTDGRTCKTAHFTVYIPEIGFTIERMCEFRKGENEWISMPSYGVKDPSNSSKYSYKTLCYFDANRHEAFLDTSRKALKVYKEKFNNKDENVKEFIDKGAMGEAKREAEKWGGMLDFC